MKAQLRLVTGGANSFRNTAGADEQKYFAGYLRSTLKDFERLGRRNRILCLSVSETRELAVTVTQIGRVARSLGHKRLAMASMSMAFLLEEVADSQLRQHQSLTLKDAFALFVEMAQNVMEEGNPTLDYIQRRRAQKASDLWDILVVDPDEDFWIDRHNHLLEDCNPRYARSGHEAVETLTGFQPDLVVLEHDLDGMVSAEMIDRLKTLPDKQDIPVAVISDQTNSDVVVTSLVRGAFDFIPKTLPETQIRDRLMVPLTVGRQRLYRA